MKRRLIFHPILIAVMPVLLLYAHNIREAPARDMLIPLLVCAAVAAAIWGALTPLLRNVAAAGLATSAFFLFFQSYGHIFVFLKGFTVAGFVLGRTRFLMPLWLLLMAAAIYAVIRHRRSPQLEKWTVLANTFSLAMLCLFGVQTASFHLQRTRPQARQATQGTLGQPAAPTPSKSIANLPDIYYIVPDSYANNSTLQSVFNFDNALFTDTLRQKGFFIASKSISNYAFTGLSLSSSLNMRFLDFLQKDLGETSTDTTVLGDLMSQNQIMAFLKAKGYTLINAGSWWGPTSVNRSADVNIGSNLINDFTLELLSGSLFLPFIEEFSHNQMREKVLLTFENLGEIPKLPEPTFTLAHVICPHPPFIFGPNGEKPSRMHRILNKMENHQQYVDQVIFINKKLQEAVEKIIARSPTPPIIVIQGDHGTAYIHDPIIFTNTAPNEAYLKEQMRIFNAYYLPGKGRNAVYPSITPVNTFRAIFNAYFNAGFPMLPDESFYSNHILPYAFKNVTKTVAFK